MDRDKVIQALECCKEYYINHDVSECKKCSYNGARGGIGCEWLNADALALIKEQENELLIWHEEGFHEGYMQALSEMKDKQIKKKGDKNMIKYEREDRKVNQSAPWVSYYHGLQALFEGDPDIKMEFSEEKKEVVIKVAGQEKYEALSGLIPQKKEFGNITLQIKLVPCNWVKNSARVFDRAFNGNPNFSFVKVVSSPAMSNPMTFVVFQKNVAQYFDDNLGDLYGNRNTLYENLAKELLNTPEGVFYCTDK